MSNHIIAGPLWLALCATGIASAGYYGGKNAQSSQMKAEVGNAINKAEAGKLDAAIADLKALCSKYQDHPDSGTLWLNLGIAYQAANNPDAAEMAFNNSLEIDPKDYDATAELATIAVMRKDNEKALTLLEKIPKGEGRVKERLETEPLWRQLAGPRMDALRQKFGVEARKARRWKSKQ